MALETVIVAVDGSDDALAAARSGLALLQPADHLLVATVVEKADPSLVVGSGFAGGVMTEAELAESDDAMVAGGKSDVEAAIAALALDNAESVIARGDPGRALCDLAAERSARAIVMGSRGRGGISGALLGSVSDFVVRNAGCPVIITTPTD